MRLGGAKKQFENSPKGLRTLRTALGKCAAPWVFCEATGGYERALLQMLHQGEIPVTMVNPARVRAFALSEGVKAKNDPIDIAMIERFAQEKDLSPPPPPPHPELTALMDRRRHMSNELTREKTRLQNSPKRLHPSIRRMIAHLQREIDRLEKAIRQQIEKSEACQRAATLMQETKGVGEVTAWAIIAYLPEITALNCNQTVSLVGLAPFDLDSGKLRGARHISAGRQKVRDIPSMAATCAAQHNPVIKPYVEGLRARGEPYKSACTAAMRKRLLHLQSNLKKTIYALFRDTVASKTSAKPVEGRVAARPPQEGNRT